MSAYPFNLWPVAICLCLALPSFAAEPETSTPDSKESPPERSRTVEKSVVKVFATLRYPDPYKPWTKASPSEVSGTGVVIEGNRILTSGHVVLYASQVQVQAEEAGDKTSATVEAIAPGMDLAVLKVDDASFFETHPPLAREKHLPAVADVVMAYGYPKGGRTLSITKGIVSRIEFASYNFPASGLRVQIDAAINSGNSGGPAVVNNRMIGLAFARLGSGDNIGYIVPCEEIDLFLADIADGHYDGKPAIFDSFQTLENPALRTFLKLDKSVEGMVVHKPYTSTADYPLKEWDVISRIGDTPIDDQGNIKINGGARVNFRYMVQRIAKNGKVPLTVVRDSKPMQIDLPVIADYPRVIPDLEGSYPSYFVYGPLVFSGATVQFVGGLNRSYFSTALSAAGSPLLKRISDKPAFEGEQLVVISSPFFPHKLTKGYDNPLAEVVKSINGTKIKNLKHLVEVLRDSKDEFIRVEYDSRYGETLVFPREQMVSATEEILTDNGLRSQGSADVLAVWNKKL